MKQILRIDASARRKNSYSRVIADKLIAEMTGRCPSASVKTYDLYANCYLLSEAMVEGMPAAQNTVSDEQLLTVSEVLIEELMSSDALVLAVPVYNFSIPAALKAYIDLVVRAGRTFRYGPQGPEGLLKHLKVYVVVTSNGTPLYGDGDFVSVYLEYIFNFLGVKEIQFINGTQILLQGADNVMQQSSIAIDKVLSYLLKAV